MKLKNLSTTLLVLAMSGPLVLVSTTADAGNFHGSYSRTRIGPNGGTVSHSGSCNSGSGCSRSTTATGPGGHTYSATHSAQANGQGGLNRSATYSGPNGSVSRSVDTHRYPNATVQNVTDTGPSGQVRHNRWTTIY
jgi:hypothetical protein